MQFYGIALHQGGHGDQAVDFLERALALDPKSATAHSNLGSMLSDLGRNEDARDHLEQAVGLNPGLADAHSNLGTVLERLWRPDRAMEHLRTALTLNPRSPVNHSNLGHLLQKLGHNGDAETHYRTAIELDPGFAQARVNYATLLQRKLDYAQALSHLQTVIERTPDHAAAHLNLAAVLDDLGMIGEARAHIDKAIAIEPTAAAASNRLFTLMYDEQLSPAELAEEFRAFGARFADPLLPAELRHDNTAEPERRLRVGYVSPDFRGHAVAFYLEPLLSHHHSEAVEIFCYAEITTEDQATARFRELADHWRPTAGLDDEAMARLIREDRIDILVDYAGHTGGNRLLVFARKPAPVQVVHPIGLMQTTGIAAIDYVIGDEWVAPPGSEKYFAETVHRLPRAFVSFQPDPAWPGLTPLPEAAPGAGGHITFASFNKPARIGPACARLWTRVLEAVPGSRLLLKHPDYREDMIAERVRGLFADLGPAIGHGRVETRPVADGWAREMGVYAEIDIALDTWPMSGGSTNCIALWMGVPVVTLAGEAVHSRQSLSALHAAGFAEGATESEAEFVARAADLAGDTGRLAELRAGLRGRMQASPLMDHREYARATENAYRAMWEEWCQASTGGKR